MKDKVINLVGGKLDSLNVFIDDVYEEKQGNIKTFYVVLDSESIIDLDTVVKATEILNPLLEKSGILPKDIDVLDIYAKEKGDA